MENDVLEVIRKTKLEDEVIQDNDLDQVLTSVGTITSKRYEDNVFRDDVFQSNYITKTFLPFSVLQANLFTIIISTLKEDTLTYTLNLKQIMEMLEITPNNYQTIVDAFNALYDKTLELDNGERVKKIRLLSMIEYTKNYNEDGYFTMEISNSIIPYLFSLRSNFTIYSLQNYLVLSSTYSKKLFQLMSMWRVKKSLVISGADFQKVMGINYKRFTSVIERVIEPSLEEIKNKTSIKNIKFHKIKTGKKITHIKFDFEFVDRQLKLQYPTYLPSAIDLELYQRMVEKFRLSKVQTTKIMDNVSTKEIKMTLRDIQMNVNDGKVHNVGAYSFRTFQQKFGIV